MTPKIRLFLCLVLLGSCPCARAAEEVSVDVAVYGATPGGIAAAIAAAGSGASVLLVEPTHRVGGLLTSGLSHTDFHSWESLSGSFLDFARRVEAYYIGQYGMGSPQAEACWRGVFGEPKVNLLVLQRMLAEQPSLKVETRLVLDEVAKSGPLLTKAVFSGPGGSLAVEARIFIDGSYEGDLMAAAGVSWRAGREGRDEYGEELAPERADDELQGYNFRFCATTDPENRVAIQAPPGYQREDFLDVLPVLATGRIKSVFGYPSGCIVKAHEPALPNNKYDINDVSRGLVRLSMPGRNLGWPDGDAATRLQIFDDHLRYNVGLLYFMQNDEAVPADLREGAAAWGWCKDEFEDTGHLPPQLYVREARRMVGARVYRQQDSEHAPGDARAKLFRDAIAMGDYGNNCHGTNHEGPVAAGKHGGEFYNPVPPYQVPYGTLLPKPGEARNLLVPVAVSATHVGFCALRLEPIWMSLGQAAGHAAALALETGAAVQEVEVAEIQERLWQDRSATVYVSDVTDGDADFVAVQWWGTQGGLHGLAPMPERPGQRGANLHGQYFEANPGHEAGLELELTPELRERWLILASRIGIDPSDMDGVVTRGEFIRAARASVR
jgi:hypothetical protein